MIELEENHFERREAAEAEIGWAKLHQSEFTIPEVDGAPHWHRFDACLYLLEGTLYLTDVAKNKVLTVQPGCKVTIPQGTVHAERSSGYRVLLGSSVPPEQFGDPVDVPANQG